MNSTSMTDTDRILEALNVLTQQIANVECELAGVRADIQHIGVGQDNTKKKLTTWNDNYTPPSWRLPASAPGATTPCASRNM